MDKTKLTQAKLQLQQFAKKNTIDGILEETLNLAEQITESRIGFFHFVNPDQTTLQLRNWSTGTKLYFCTATGVSRNYELSKAGAWADCIREKRIIIHDQLNESGHNMGFPEGHPPVDRDICVPILRNNFVTAVAGVGNKESEYTQEDVDNFSDLVNFSWDIIDSKLFEFNYNLGFNNWISTFDAIQDGIIILDHEQKIIDCNQAYCDFVHLQKDDILGNHCFNLVHGGHCQVDDCCYLKMLHSQKRSSDTVILKDRYFEIILDPIFDENHSIIGAVHIFKDIHQQKLNEIALTKSEEKFRMITEKITDVVWLMDLQGKSLFVSPSVVNFTGYTVEEYLSQSITDRFTPESAALAIRSLESGVKEFLKNGAENSKLVKTLSLEYRCKNGEIKIGEVIITPFFNQENQFVAIHGVTRDITAQELMYKKMLISDQNLNAAQRLAHIGSWYWDLSNYKISWSEELFHINQMDPAKGEPSYEELKNSYTLTSWEVLAQAIQNAVEKQEAYALFLDIKRKDGSIRHTYSFGEPKFDNSGAVIALQGTVQDITEQHLAKIALEEQMNELHIFHKATMDREIKMIELKEEINQLLEKLGEPKKYQTM